MAAFILFISAPDAQASQICNDVVIGQTPGEIVSNTDGNTVYSDPQPIYEKQCYWKYGAIAIDPVKRSYYESYNSDDIEQSKNYVLSQCGANCTWISFSEDYAYIALSDDSKFSGTSTRNSDDAKVQCMIAGGVDCSTVLVGSSTSYATYLKFGAIAYDVATSSIGAAFSGNMKSEAERVAKQSCGSPGCWVYSFQTGYGALALSDDGILYGAWSARNEASAGKVALKDCEAGSGKKSCSVVMTGAAREDSTFVRKPVK